MIYHYHYGYWYCNESNVTHNNIYAVVAGNWPSTFIIASGPLLKKTACLLKARLNMPYNRAVFRLIKYQDLPGNPTHADIT